MAQRQGHLDEKAVWDDSALVDSWNEALKEYKKYHSIQAKGGSIEDLEDENPTTAASLAGGQDGWANGEANVSGIRLEAATGERDLMSAGHEHMHNASSTGAGDLPPDADNAAGQASAKFQVPAAFPPQAILGSVQDENLKRLLIAWYYAGYYTGLIEGNQQAQ
ncbi:hypothetical protein HRG_000887 [Hirsutella rhossiliensis]|uniref:Survival Motor Neuron Gemin2-binding domain-containing protein n=1 Tax=Hirsutella rhossiliensis TaxID=111463 RepID=A0A9P8N7H3_9HYPO|nr:uncharacterized protein HRG_00887 [Hirsutella rhossiliensis]KAH0968245.1 hypothetical protein HRG_00887 [Hirsutella rhossiliensis]